MHQLGLFCGTFNPIHLGHLLVAENARDQFALEKVIFVTSARPPHRNDVFLASEARHEMVALAVAGNSHFEASTIELERVGPSYTVDTVKHFRKLYGAEVELNLLIGADNVIHLRSWHNVEELYSLCRILIAARLDDVANLAVSTRLPGSLSESERQVLEGSRYEIIEFPVLAISSSSIRKRVQEGKSILYMVPSAVSDIIEKQHYYSHD